jgi:hypothetical protein
VTCLFIQNILKALQVNTYSPNDKCNRAFEICCGVKCFHVNSACTYYHITLYILLTTETRSRQLSHWLTSLETNRTPDSTVCSKVAQRETGYSTPSSLLLTWRIYFFKKVAPWSSFIHENLVVPQLAKKFTTSYGIRRFIIVLIHCVIIVVMFTRWSQWTASQATWIKRTSLHPTSLRSILILSSHPRPDLSFSFSDQNCVYISPLPPSEILILNHIYCVLWD